MWTSTASKPARSNAAAISICPLTPCSRRIATRGRAPPRARTAPPRRRRCRTSRRPTGPGSSLSTRAACSSSAQVGSSRSACIACVVSDQIPRRMLRRSSNTRAAAAAQDDRDRRAARGRARGRRRQTVRAQDLPHARDVGGAHRSTAPSSSANSAGERIVAERRRSRCPARRRPRTPSRRSVTNRPPSLRSWYASTMPAAVSSWTAAKKPRAARDRRDRAASRRAARRPAPAPSRRGGSCRARDRPAAARRRRRRRRPTAPASARGARRCTGANALTTSDSGAVTLRRSPRSVHVVRIDIESLPTGIAIPSAGQSSMPTARTAS